MKVADLVFYRERMFSRTMVLLIVGCSLFFPFRVTAQRTVDGNGEKNGMAAEDSLSRSISLLRGILNSQGEWYLSDDSYRKSFKGVVDYAENDPIDSVVIDVRKVLSDQQRIYLFERRPQDIRDKDKVPGYISAETEAAKIESRRRSVMDSLRRTTIQLPEEILREAIEKAPLIPQGNPQELINNNDYHLPASFRASFYKNLVTMPFPANTSGSEMDTLRNRAFAMSRQAYNDSVISRLHDSLLVQYREQYIANYAAREANILRKSIDSQNYKTLMAFNDAEVARMNDSARVALNYLTTYAESDSVLIGLTNLSGDRSEIWTANRAMLPIRTYLKNAQNDSLAVILYNNGKGDLRLVIDDGVKFTRFVETQQREIKFQPKAPDNNLVKVKIKTPEALAWNLFGNGTVGFTQTALSNWSKGGESALSLLFVGKYNANYSKKKLKWESSAELRYGVNQTKARGFEKNDDKIEIQSRMGYSAFKHWYYSAEGNFRTQIARGYKYPDKDNPISTFMAPGYLTFSLGLDYKPNKNFSLFLSPLTSKSTFVRDTALIDPTNFGLDPGTKKRWEAGLIVKSNWKTNIMENISYETKGELFNNYQYTLQKFTFEWEQLLIMQVTPFISTRVMAQTIYDYNTKFPVTDSEGTVIGKKAKWQFKELFTIGFSYKF